MEPLTAEANDFDTQMYCAGLPFCGYRTLQVEEIRAATKRANAQLFVSTGAFASIFAIFLVGFFVVWIGVGPLTDYLRREGHPEWLQELLGFILPGGLAFSIGIYFGWQEYRRHTRAQEFAEALRCAKAGKVRVFSGILTREHWHETMGSSPLNQLLRAKLLEFNARGQVLVELHADQDWLYSVNRILPNERIALPVQRTVPRPPDEPESEWSGRQKIVGDRRRLSDAETAELIRNTNAYMGKFFISVVCVPVGLSIASAMRLTRAGMPTIGNVIIAVCVSALLVWKVPKAIGEFLRLHLDIKERCVVISAANENDQYDPAKPASEQKIKEVLVNSRFQWTMDGRPGTWRGMK